MGFKLLQGEIIGIGNILMVDDPLQQALPLGRPRGAHGRSSVGVMVHVGDGCVELGRRRNFVV